MSIPWKRDPEEVLQQIREILSQHHTDIQRLWKLVPDWATDGTEGQTLGGPNPPDGQSGSGSASGGPSGSSQPDSGTGGDGTPYPGSGSSLSGGGSGSPQSGVSGGSYPGVTSSGSGSYTSGTGGASGGPYAPSGGGSSNQSGADSGGPTGSGPGSGGGGGGSGAGSGSDGHSGASGSYESGSGAAYLCGCEQVAENLFIRDSSDNSLIDTLEWNGTDKWVDKASGMAWEFSCSSNQWKLDDLINFESGTSSVACSGTLATYGASVFTVLAPNGCYVSDT